MSLSFIASLGGFKKKAGMAWHPHRPHWLVQDSVRVPNH